MHKKASNQHLTAEISDEFVSLNFITHEEFVKKILKISINFN